jgi:hypothetical protein
VYACRFWGSSGFERSHQLVNAGARSIDLFENLRGELRPGAVQGAVRGDIPKWD